MTIRNTKRRLHSLLVCGAALLMLGSVGAGAGQLAQTHASSTVRGSAMMKSQSAEVFNHVLQIIYADAGKAPVAEPNVQLNTSSDQEPQQASPQQSAPTQKQASTKPATKSAKKQAKKETQKAKKAAKPTQLQKEMAEVGHYHGKKVIKIMPAGLEIDKTGGVYLNGQYVGYVTQSKALVKTLKAHHSNSALYRPGNNQDLAYGIQVGKVGKQPLMINISRANADYYNNTVAANDDSNQQWHYYDLHQSDNSAIMKQGYNGGRSTRLLKEYIFRDLNIIRHRNGVRPLKESQQLAPIARTRAIQADHAYNTLPQNYVHEMNYYGKDKPLDNWVHGVDTHQTFADDAGPLSLSVFNYQDSDPTADECLTQVQLGKLNLVDLGFHHVYNLKTIKQLAWAMTVTEMVEHDKGSHNSHRKSVLNKTTTHVAIALKSHHDRPGLKGYYATLALEFN